MSPNRHRARHCRGGAPLPVPPAPSATTTSVRAPNRSTSTRSSPLPPLSTLCATVNMSYMLSNFFVWPGILRLAGPFTPSRFASRFACGPAATSCGSVRRMRLTPLFGRRQPKGAPPRTRLLHGGGPALAHARAFARNAMTFSQPVASHAHPLRLPDSVRCDSSHKTASLVLHGAPTRIPTHRIHCRQSTCSAFSTFISTRNTMAAPMNNSNWLRNGRSPDCESIV